MMPDRYFELLSRILDDAVSEDELEEFRSALSKSEEPLHHFKKQILLSELLSQEFNPARSSHAFFASMGMRAQYEKDGARFVRSFRKKADVEYASHRLTRGQLWLHMPGSVFKHALYACITALTAAVKKTRTGIMDIRAAVRRISWLLASLAIHTACIAVIALLVVHTAQQHEEEIAIIDIEAGRIRGKGTGRVSAMGIKQKEIKISDYASNIEEPDVLKEEIYEFHTPEDIEMMHMSQHRMGHVAEVHISEEAWFDTFSISSNILAVFPSRTGPAKRGAIARYGGSQETESAVLAALRWFKRHQAPDGSWSFCRYHQQCKLNPPCEHNNIRSIHNRHNAATGLALLCFLGAGHTHKAGKFRQQVADCLAYLENAQDMNGSFAQRNYVHGIATMALAEAYGMTKSHELRDQAQKAVDVILSRQNEYFGWDYGKSSFRNDLSITGWQIMALKSAQSSGLDIGNAFEGARKFVDKMTPEVIGGSDPQLAGKVAYTYNSDSGALGHRGMRGLTTLPAIGLLCRIFAGEDTNSRMLRAHGNRLLEHLPATYKNGNMYFWYYATLGMFQMKGHYWDTWNKALKKVLCENQRVGGCADGSWDPTSNNIDFGSLIAGRVFSTAAGCLSLEVYYRYLPFTRHK